MGTAPPPVALEIAMSWIILFFAGLFEVGWAVGLKYTEGFSKPIVCGLVGLKLSQHAVRTTSPPASGR